MQAHPGGGEQEDSASTKQQWEVEGQPGIPVFFQSDSLKCHHVVEMFVKAQDYSSNSSRKHIHDKSTQETHWLNNVSKYRNAASMKVFPMQSVMSVILVEPNADTNSKTKSKQKVSLIIKAD